MLHQCVRHFGQKASTVSLQKAEGFHRRIVVPKNIDTVSWSEAHYNNYSTISDSPHKHTLKSYHRSTRRLSGCVVVASSPLPDWPGLGTDPYPNAQVVYHANSFQPIGVPLSGGANGPSKQSDLFVVSRRRPAPMVRMVALASSFEFFPIPFPSGWQAALTQAPRTCRTHRPASVTFFFPSLFHYPARLKLLLYRAFYALGLVFMQILCPISN